MGIANILTLVRIALIPVFVLAFYLLPDAWARPATAGIFALAAITGHRKQRAQARLASPLEGVQGIGPRRRRQLLLQFGGLQGIARAGVEDLSRVPGISKQLAQKVYEAFH